MERSEDFNYDQLEEIEYILFTAAISGPDKCAQEFNYCWQINVVGTNFFIHKAIEKGCKVIFLSSDAVFGDISGQIYTEISATQANTPYGCMKKAVEDEFIGNKNFKALRLSYVVSAKDKFVMYCLDCIKKNTIAEIYHPFYRNCIVISDVIKAVIWLLENWDMFKPQVLNLAGEELVSRVRIADELNRYLKKELHYIVSTPEEEFFLNRPQITQMKSIYLQQYSILDDGTFTEKIQKELEDINL